MPYLFTYRYMYVWRKKYTKSNSVKTTCEKTHKNVEKKIKYDNNERIFKKERKMKNTLLKQKLNKKVGGKEKKKERKAKDNWEVNPLDNFCHPR